MVGGDGVEPLAETALLQSADPTSESNTALKISFYTYLVKEMVPAAGFEPAKYSGLSASSYSYPADLRLYNVHTVSCEQHCICF